MVSGLSVYALKNPLEIPYLLVRQKFEQENWVDLGCFSFKSVSVQLIRAGTYRESAAPSP